MRRAEPVLSFDQAKKLVAQHGTPLLAVSRQKLAESYQTVRNHLPGVELFYAAKANAHRLVLQTLQAQGASIDICSVGELEAAVAAGFTTDRMIHTHPCKSDSNLLECYERGIRWFVYDDEYELDKVARLALDVNMVLRVAMSAPSCALNLSSKFGAAASEAIRLLLAARRRGLRPSGISFHVGSQCLDPHDFHPAIASIRELYDEAMDIGMDIQLIDIGGGFPAPYRGQSLMPLASYCDIVNDALRSHFEGLPARIIAEPGRALCAEGLTLVTRVIGKSVREGTIWYYLDDGLYGSFSAKRPGHTDFDLIVENHASTPLYRCVVAGPTCDSGDVLYRDYLLPELEIGAIVMVPSMGAYTSASACGFNGLPLACSIAVD
jgi:ornithine decarboxylase